MNNSSYTKKQTATTFGERSIDYLLSENHRSGTDLDILSKWTVNSKFVLDIATGAGHTANLFLKKPSRIIAIDSSIQMVKTALEAYPGLEVAVADAESLPFTNDSFDTISCRIAAHHFPNPFSFLSEVARVSQTNGFFLFEDNVSPNLPHLSTFINTVEHLRDPTHITSHTIDQWTSWIENVGFTIDETFILKKTIAYDLWTAQSKTSSTNLELLQILFTKASTDIKTTFDIIIEDGEIKSFSNTKLILKATLQNQ